MAVAAARDATEADKRAWIAYIEAQYPTARAAGQAGDMPDAENHACIALLEEQYRAARVAARDGLPQLDL